MNILMPIFLTIMLPSPYEVPTINFDNANSIIDLTTDTLTLNTKFEIINSTGYVEEFTDSDDIVLSDYIDGSIYYVYLEYGNIFVEVSRSYFSFEFSVNIILENQSGLSDNLEVSYFHEYHLTELYDVNAFSDYIPFKSKYLAYDFELYDGYNRGFNEGLDVGYENGYTQGVKVGRLEGNAVNNIVDWFGNVWDSLANFLSLEIAPNLKIGTIVTLPIVMAVLLFALKALIQ